MKIVVAQLIFLIATCVYADSNAFVEDQDASSVGKLCQKTIDQVGAVNRPSECPMVPEAKENRPEYEECSSENNYLEKLLSPTVNLEFKEHANSIHPNCIFEAQNRYPQSGYTGACKTDDALPKHNFSKPCLSPKYLSLVYNSFSQVAKCFKIPENQLFPSLALESGFQVNALGQNMDAGISQLTGSLIDAINERYFDEYLIRARDSNECAAVIPVFRKMSSDPIHRCSAMNPPNNPMQSLIYAAILYDTNRQVIAAGLNSVKSKLPKDMDFEGLRQALTVLSFNAAPGSINLALRQFIASRAGTLTADDFKMTRDVPTTFVSYMKEHFPVEGENQAHRRNTISFYLPAALSLNERIEDKMRRGEKCMSPALRKLY